MPSRIQIALAAILFSTGGAAIKATNLDGWQVAGLRSVIAALFLIAVLPDARKDWNWRSALVGTTFVTSLLLYVLANKETTAANVIFLISASPVYVLLLSPWLLKERLRRRDFLTVAMMIGGLSLFFVAPQVQQATAPNPFLGNLLGVLAGVSWAFTVLGLRWLSRDRKTSASAAAIGNLLVFAVCLPRITPVENVTSVDLVIVAYLGVFQIGLAYVFLTAAMRKVPAFEAAIFLLLEPVLSPLWAYWVHGEAIDRWAIAGGFLIVAAIATPALYDAMRSSGAGSDAPG